MHRLLIILAIACASAQAQNPKATTPPNSTAVAKPAPPPIPPFPDPADVLTAMKKAATYYRRNTSVVGGYGWSWPKDLSTSQGENHTSPTLIMIQPPGTPAMGLAFLRAFKLTGDALYKQAAKEAAQSLLWSQLASGGWDSDYDFDPKLARKWHYRRDLEAGDTERGTRHADSTLDDEKTETALLFLLELAHTKEFISDADLQSAMKFGFDGLIASQAANGGWGQHFDGPADITAPVTKARIPKDWPHLWPGIDYTRFYTLNDGNILETMRVLLRAYELTKEDRFLTSAKKAGDFLLLAQLPEPQPAWAQQYNRDMEPVWARKFEPPAVSSLESMTALQGLHELWIATGDDKYHQPHKAALAWLERSKLPDGQYARFYELETNKPLYCKRETYELTFDDSDLPTHYGFKIDDLGEKIDRLKATLAMTREECLRKQSDPTDPKKWASAAKSVAPKVVAALQKQSKQGYWTSGEVISAGEFVAHVRSMSRYVEAAQKGGDFFVNLRAKANADVPAK